MNLKDKTENFVIKVHCVQLRKSDSENPMVIQIINIANMLEEYGFDEIVIVMVI